MLRASRPLRLTDERAEFLGTSLSTSSLPIITVSVPAPGEAKRSHHTHTSASEQSVSTGVYPGMTAASNPRTRNTDLGGDGNKAAKAPIRKKTPTADTASSANDHGKVREAHAAWSSHYEAGRGNQI